MKVVTMFSKFIFTKFIFTMFTFIMIIFTKFTLFLKPADNTQGKCFE